MISGFGKKSKVNNLLKTKIVPPYVKKTSKGLKVIKTHAKSK